LQKRYRKFWDSEMRFKLDALTAAVILFGVGTAATVALQMALA
jgi:hypothetical protein